MATRGQPPKPASGWHIQETTPDEMAEIARSLNNFYRNYNLYEPQTGDSLKHWGNATIREERYHRYLVVRGGSDAILAGTGVSEEFRISEFHISNLSLGMKIANMFLHLVPTDNISRSISIVKYWYAPDQRAALQYLVEHIRWAWQDQVNMVMISCDVHNPVRQAFPTRPWTPIHVSSIVADAPMVISSERLLAQ
jgi:hypothetical protein